MIVVHVQDDALLAAQRHEQEDIRLVVQIDDIEGACAARRAARVRPYILYLCKIAQWIAAVQAFFEPIEKSLSRSPRNTQIFNAGWAGDACRSRDDRKRGCALGETPRKLMHPLLHGTAKNRRDREHL